LFVVASGLKDLDKAVGVLFMAQSFQTLSFELASLIILYVTNQVILCITLGTQYTLLPSDYTPSTSLIKHHFASKHTVTKVI